MNKNQLRKILKPLIKECIKEVIFEDGTLSTIISEVVKGTSGLVLEQRQQKIRETTEKVLETHEETMRRLQENKIKADNQRKTLLDAIGRDAYNGVDLFEGFEQKRKQLLEQKRKMLDAIGKGAYNGVDLFEGTTPMPRSQGSSSPHGSKALDGVDPNDPGVDISQFGMSKQVWKKLAGK